MAGQVTNGPLAGGHSQNVQRVRISSQNFLFQDFIWTARQTGVVHFFVVGHQVPIPRRKSSQEEAPLHAWVHQEVQVREWSHNFSARDWIHCKSSIAILFSEFADTEQILRFSHPQKWELLDMNPGPASLKPLLISRPASKLTEATISLPLPLESPW